MKRKLLVVSVAGLDAVTAAGLTGLPGARFAPLRPPFPAVTCTAQGTFRTGVPASRHGMTGNGFFDRRLRKAFFWEQSSALVEGPRIWDPFRRAGGTVALLFWQQAMGEEADFILTPAPVHKHHGGMILDCYSRPAALYPRLRTARGEFPLHRYWGPLASPAVGDWIAGATADVMAREAPGLVLTYLPTLDYDYQRVGPGHAKSRRAAARLNGQLRSLLAAAAREGYDWMIWGDYAIEPCVGGAVYPNRALLREGLLVCREVRGRLYADLNASRAFAMVDHAVAHVYLKSPEDAGVVRQVLAGLAGVDAVVSRDERPADPRWSEAGDLARHERAGDLVLAAVPGSWFAYPWWTAEREAPDYARHVDIHNKPGYDPCELVMQWWPPGVSGDASRVRGTHGRTDRPAAWACSWGLPAEPAALVDLSAAVAGYLDASVRKERGL
jgi:hypothetical protein